MAEEEQIVEENEDSSIQIWDEAEARKLLGL